MLFNSLPFLVFFLPIVLFGATRLRGQRLLTWITLASFVFYGLAGHAWFLIPMLFTTVLDFFLAPYIAEAPAGSRKKRALLLVSLCGNLGLLAYFKYSGLFVSTGRNVYEALGGTGAPPAWLDLFDVILPAGISFYTFQTLSYVIDVYRGHCAAERNFMKFSGFVSFFPHLVAGPLTRHDQLIPALERVAEKGIRPRWEAGIYLFAIGLCKKVLIADRVAGLIDPVIDAGAMSTPEAWVCMLGYAVQIYFDFSGYSDMAIGLARLFDIELPQNFNSPYQALNPSDFWRRWHMTLSSWLRDYLYISLGGNRCSPARRNVNLMLTMILGGLWHGASWTFAFWGLLHGSYLVLFHVLGGPWSKLPVPAQRLGTFLLVCIAWVFFRAHTFGSAAAWLGSLIGVGAGPGTMEADKLALAGALVVASLVVAMVAKNASSNAALPAITAPRRLVLGLAAGVSVILMGYSSKFLYFQF